MRERGIKKEPEGRRGRDGLRGVKPDGQGD